ncbi:glycosyltransferase family 4 protein [Agreia sp. VKM Ac-1783]|uniref:rhamnosyltransferase WsaF family glycosyltransferase n=1 Tax=Agreia sp. VKM Ac-1783 TaxID=1938889 RepID=UPI00111CC495|nr:glycosyltransferase family 4 protein [Agreia sp. VKM Ac-1783]
MSLIKKAWLVLRSDGPKSVVSKAIHRWSRSIPPEAGTIKLGFLVKTTDASEVDWSVPHPAVVNPIRVDGKTVVAWIMSPPGESSGGHQNIFRFINFLEEAGHTVRVYLYSAHTPYSVALVKEMVKNSPSYPDVKASFEDYTDEGVAADVTAIFATGWETAYPSFRDRSPARRFYFVQDFEPYFYAVGSDTVLAENTYHFGFEAITAGGFLAHKLSTEYGMKASSFDFGANRELYSVTNTERRKEVFFYARPVTARRGFELGILALEHFARARPDYIINLAGWDVSAYDIPFDYVNLKDLKIDELNEVYNRCATGLVISLTNMSLLPLELLSAGVIPVVNEGPNNRLVSDNPFLAYSAASPHALANKMIEIVDRQDLPEYAVAASESVRGSDWETSGRAFVEIFESSLRG